MSMGVLFRIEAPSVFGWCAAALAVAGIGTAWADPAAGHLLHAMVLSVAAAWLAYVSITGSGGTHWLVLPLLGAAAWGSVQVAQHWTVYQFETWNAATAWLARAALFQLAYFGLQSHRRRENTFTFLLFCGAALAATGILQWFTSGGKVLWIIPTKYSSEVMGTFLNRDHYAVFVELVLPLALARALLGAGPRSIWMSIAALLYGSVIGCGSRAGIAVAGMEAAVIGAVAIRRGAGNRRAVLTLAACLALGTGVVGWQYAWQRFQLPDPFQFRREMLAATVQMIHARPVTGFGLGTWPTVYPAFAVFDPPGLYMNHAHNDWAEWASDGGVPFAAALFAVALGAVWLTTRNWWAMGVPAAMVHALVDFPMQKPALAALAFFLLGAAAAASRAQRNSHRVNP